MQSQETGMEKEDLNSRGLNYVDSHSSVEADGKKLPDQASNWSYDMSNEVKRMYTFANFPHKTIILKLHESGYFYSGNDDTTICYKCHAAVCGWTPDDDPRSFHESSCSYRNSDDQNKNKELRSVGNTSASLLDEPIQDINGTDLLSPIILPSAQSLGAVSSSLGQNLRTVPHASQSRSGGSLSLQISTLSGDVDQPLHLSPSAVEVSVESNASERGQVIPQNAGILHPSVNATTNPHQERHFTPSGNAVDACHFPTQVSDADVDITDPGEGSSTLRHSSNLGQTRLHNIQHEGTTVDPVVISQDTEEQVNPMQLDTEWGSAFPCDEPEHPEMRNINHRLESFNAFWTDGIVGNINEIALAGFYCFDINRTRCWYCGCGGHEWTPNENPWELHAALYPNCEFLLQQKGPDYISDVCSRRPQQPASPPFRTSPRSPASPATPESPRLRRISFSSNSSDDSPFSSMESFDIRGQNLHNITIVGGNVIHHHWGRHSREAQPPRVVDPREEEAKRKNLLQTSLNSEIALTAMEMGFELPMIKRVIKRKIWRTDETYPSPSALLDDLLHPPVDLDSESDDEEMNENATGNATGSTNETPELGIRGNGEDEGTPPAATNSSEDMDQKEMDEKLREFEHEKRCKVCLDRDADVVFMPCGHLCTCVDCAQALRTCPLCRKRIQKSIKTYSS